ncbi:MAG: kynureninase [Bacteroidetes bacterium]|nr:MAG: kynureninase [Bacteroidota bacterium]
MTNFINSLSFATDMDSNDPLAGFRDRFYFPQMNGKDVVYFTGNSLGLQPKTTQDLVLKELEDWATWGVEGHFHARNPWFSYQDILTEQIASILGAKPEEVVSMNSLTTNLHLLMVSFYRPTKSRYKILCEYDLFPSDLYALQSQASFHGFNPDDALIALEAREGEYALRTDDILQAIEQNKDSLCTLMLGAVNYYTGQFFDIDRITKAAHAAGATVGYNLAHAAGNVPLKLHDWDVDFACFCSYKYLNASPGGVSGIFVHEKFAHDKTIPRFAGWWGNDPETRFKMPRTFVPAVGARSWQLSNAPVLSMAALKASLDIFEEAGMQRLHDKSTRLTGFLEAIINEINEKKLTSAKLKPIKIITPQNPAERGCQLSLVMEEKGKQVYQKLMEAGIIIDWREPDVIRVAPVPLYNTFTDVYRFGKLLQELV